MKTGFWDIHILFFTLSSYTLKLSWSQHEFSLNGVSRGVITKQCESISVLRKSIQAVPAKQSSLFQIILLSFTRFSLNEIDNLLSPSSTILLFYPVLYLAIHFFTNSYNIASLLILSYSNLLRNLKEKWEKGNKKV